MPQIEVEFYDGIINEVRGVPPGVRFQVREIDDTESYDVDVIRTDPHGDLYVKLYDSMEPPVPDALGLANIQKEIKKMFKIKKKFPNDPLGDPMIIQDFTNEFPKPMILLMYSDLPNDIENPIPGIMVHVTEIGDMSMFDAENVKKDKEGNEFVDYGTFGSGE